MITQVTSVEELRELYPLLEEGAEIIAKGSNNPGAYFPPDIYKNIVDGRFILFVLHDDDTVWGWATVFFDTDMSGGKVSVCQDLYIKQDAPKHFLNEYIDFFEKFSQSENCKSTVFFTAREAWRRVVEPKEYKLVGYIFKKEL